MTTQFENLMQMAERAGREPIRPRPTPRRAALSGERDDDDRDDDDDQGGIADALADLPASEAGEIVREAIRIVHDELTDHNGRLPLPAERSEPATEEELRKLKSELAEHAKSLPATEILEKLVAWLRLAIASRQSRDHGREVADAADSFARQAGYHRERIGLSNTTKPFRLYFCPPNQRKLQPCR